MAICDRNNAESEMNIVIVGHVDHGKSTVIGRLLADTHSLPQGKLEQIKELCRRTSKPFEYAFLLDALKDERSQGITIDAARCFFKTDKRKYIIIDAPGHIEFLKNMITGASRADAALLVIDAHEGICDNSRRHSYMLSMLGIKQVTVLINKLDLIPQDQREETYNRISTEFAEFLSQINVVPSHFIPVSATKGWNIAEHEASLDWYNSLTVLEALDSFEETLPETDKPFRMWVQDVYKFTNLGDERRIIAGTVSSGTLHEGDNIIFLPSGKKTTVKSIEGFNQPKTDMISAGKAAGFCMTEQIYVKRGELCSVIGQSHPQTAVQIQASVFWLGKKPFSSDRSYKIKIGSAQVGCHLEGVDGVINASTLGRIERDSVEKNEVATVRLRMERPIAFDLSEISDDTRRFVIVDGYEISGGGIITDLQEDEQARGEKLHLRNIKWIKSSITAVERAAYYKQKPEMIIITGKENAPRKETARELEKLFLDEGRIAYFLGIGNVLYGVGADIRTDDNITDISERNEHIRRLGEVANIMLDAGNILIVTASELDTDETDMLKHIVSTDNVKTVWLGRDNRRENEFDIYIPDVNSPQQCAQALKIVVNNRNMLV